MVASHLQRRGSRQRRRGRRKRTRRYGRRHGRVRSVARGPITITCDECVKNYQGDSADLFSQCPECGHYTSTNTAPKSFSPQRSPHWIPTRKRDRVRAWALAPLAATVRQTLRWRENARRRKRTGTRRRDIPVRTLRRLVGWANPWRKTKKQKSKPRMMQAPVSNAAAWA